MQKYEVKGSILGFDQTMNVEIVQIDNLFSTIRDLDNKNISFTVVNPYELREYSFDIRSNIKVLLDIKENSNLSAFNIVVIQNPLENSTVNFLAPIVINNDNMTIAQVVLDPKRHPDFGMAESIKSFM
ncbi:MAG: flagellar assembly protein FliW [Sulfurimonas sp.]|jgi:flagellar assembly factor FliW|nr:flagellar assembly protein FliW [Sulfurimonas sp.]MDD3835159.1 flagellar assembly protein FliW [Sulfurimonas sp.]